MSVHATSDYAAFLARKAISDPPTGMTRIPPLPDCLLPLQAALVPWALRRGRAALFAGTGLGKSLMELAWGQAVGRETGGDVLHFAPLAVSAQLVREAEKFGIPAYLTGTDGGTSHPRGAIPITNYQKLSHFDLSGRAGVILDESSILKSTDGHYRSALIAACADVPFRLAATATPAPNDYMELGNHAEFLGVLSQSDMLATFFTHDSGETQKWRLKGHAESDFWQWMASWAVMLRRPSDLGFSDEGYELPPLDVREHVIETGAAVERARATSTMFAAAASTLAERIAARRDTVEDRCRFAASIVFGSFGDKLATWHGNRNTQNGDAPNTKRTMPRESDGAHKAEVPKRTGNICAPTTPQQRLSDQSEPQSSRPPSTSAAASDTPKMLNTASGQKSQQGSGHPISAELRGCEISTGSTSSNIPPCSPHKVACAPSAAANPIMISSLITAMRAALSGDCSAAHAIPASVISEMTQSGLIAPWCIWCNLNDEQDALAKAFGPLAFSVRGSMADDAKEAAIAGWIAGERPVMISKPSIMGFGMNFQHCADTIFVGMNDSWEQYYQAVRRFWRFGQTRPVTVEIVSADIEGATLANIRRKDADADRMADAMVRHMADLSSDAVRGLVRDKPVYAPARPISLPAFLPKIQDAA